MGPEARFQGFYPGRAPIEAYGNGGFRFAGMSHRGSILCLPSGVRAIALPTLGGLDGAALAVVLAEREGLGVLLVGTGAKRVELPADVARILVEAGIFAEVMDTGACARTYNVLLAEDRPVAALLIAVD